MHSEDTFDYMFRAEFVTLAASLKVPSGSQYPTLHPATPMTLHTFLTTSWQLVFPATVVIPSTSALPAQQSLINKGLMLVNFRYNTSVWMHPTNIASVHLWMGCPNARAGVKIVEKKNR